MSYDLTEEDKRVIEKYNEWVTNFAYFEGPGDELVYDPGDRAKCPFCGLTFESTLAKPQTRLKKGWEPECCGMGGIYHHSLMVPTKPIGTGNRCYILRYHGQCEEAATEEEKSAVDSILVDAIYLYQRIAGGATDAEIKENIDDFMMSGLMDGTIRVRDAVEDA